MNTRVSGVRDLTVLMGEIGKTVRVEAEKAVFKTAMEIKTQAQADAPGGGPGSHVPAYAQSIDFDITRGIAGGVSAQIGPDKDREQGAYGVLLEFGGVNWPGQAHLVPAWERESEIFIDSMEKIVTEAVR